MSGGEGEGRVDHVAILQAVSDLRADLRRAENSREVTEKRLFELIDGVKGEVSEIKETVARYEGERDGERNARAETAAHHALLTPPPAPPPPQASRGWRRLGMWATIAAAVIGILGGFGQALHFVVTVGAAVYQGSKPPAH